MTYVLTPRAQADFQEIGDYIAQDNPAAAARMIETLHQKCRFLSENPRVGRERNDIAHGLRYFPAHKYLIMYRLVDEDVEIVRALHGARKIEELF